GMAINGPIAAASAGRCLLDGGVRAGKDSLVEIVRLHAKVPAVKTDLPGRPLGSEDPSAARKGSRMVWWNATGGIETTVYEWGRLQPGARVAGPAIIEGTDTTYLVPEHWDLSIDTLGNGLMERG
ncbi:MAG: hypothetical protein MUQ56_10270, partial [Thermoleophilia bacterium]|nr:hypothetical protein [Thermoleophilia bacterium]